MDHLGPKGDVLFAGHVRRPHARTWPRRSNAPGSCSRARIHDHLRRLGERLTAGIQAAIDETGVRAQVREIAGVWTIYFTDQPIRRFRDFARFAMDKNHPVQRGYRNWLLERGIYVHPHYMIRGFLTGAHTEADVDRLVEATASYLREYRDVLATPAEWRPLAPRAGRRPQARTSGFGRSDVVDGPDQVPVRGDEAAQGAHRGPVRVELLDASARRARRPDRSRGSARAARRHRRPGPDRRSAAGPRSPTR